MRYEGLVFNVSNNAQRVIFEHELKGQLSDGHWENSLPHNHWEKWCDAKVVVGGPVGRNFRASRKYDFLNSDLLDVVSSRMRLLVMIDRAFGEEAITPLGYLFETIDNACNASPITYSGLPQHEGEYWDKVRDSITDFVEANGGLENVVKHVLDQTYTLSDLKADLEAIKRASNNLTVAA